MVRITVLILVAAVACAGPGASPGPATMAPIGAWPTASVRVGDAALTVAVAGTAERRRQGLREVTDLGRLDGLLFDFPGTAVTSFTMRGVTMPIDLAWVGPDERVIEVVALEPCPADPCPTYASPGEVRWVVETARGGLAGVDPGDPFSIEP